MNLVDTLTEPEFLIAVLAAVSAAAVVFTFGVTFFGGGSKMRQRIKRVALEREKMRAEEMARLRGTGRRPTSRAPSARPPARTT